MASGLRAKLNMMKNVSTQQPVRALKAEGLLRYKHRLPLEPDVLRLSPTGLRRMGWSGRQFDIRKCLFLDTETTGLSGGAGTIAFLVGVGYVEDDTFVVEQYLMREYGDEPALIATLCARMKDFDCVCTFNGKNFDMPLLETRFTMNRMRDQWRELENIDLLYSARRAWKLRLGSCRLSRLEEMILGIYRENDLPGNEVPGRFFEFIKTGDESLLADIVQHNRQDIATLAMLLAKLCQINAAPEELSDKRDLFSMGKSLERQGELKPARELYRISAIPSAVGTIQAITGEHIAGMANWRLYLLTRKSGDVDGMRRVLEQMLARNQIPGRVCIELSKLYEHRVKDLFLAMEYAKRAERFIDETEKIALKKRMDRIVEKIKAKS